MKRRFQGLVPPSFGSDSSGGVTRVWLKSLRYFGVNATELGRVFPGHVHVPVGAFV